MLPPDYKEVFRENVREALDRNRPQSKVRVPLSSPTYGEEEVLEAIDSLLTTRVTMGEKVRNFEKKFADYIGVPHAIMVNSGSSANLLMFAALTNPQIEPRFQLKPGDEVIVPAVTWSTSIWPVIQMGCVPVFVDVDLKTLTMDMDQARAAISTKTRAIFLTHTMGNAANLEVAHQLAEDHNLLLLEDCCEALGTRYNGKLVGSEGLMGSYSFFFSHHITTIEGGMLVTSDDSLASLVRCLRAHGWSRDLGSATREWEKRYSHIDPRFLFVNVGYNLRPMEIQAAFGIHQLPKLEAFNDHRRKIAAALCEQLEIYQDFVHLPKAQPHIHHSWFGFPFILKEEFVSLRSDFCKHLEASGIETRPIIAGNLAAQPAMEYFSHRVHGNLLNARAVMEGGIYFGIHPGTSLSDATFVAEQFKEFFGSNHAKKSADLRDYRAGRFIPGGISPS